MHHSTLRACLGFSALALLALVPPSCIGDPIFAGRGGALPANWQRGDVGSVGVPGGATYEGGVFTLAGSGQDIWDTADGFQYAWQSLNGDGTIVARVLSLSNTDAWAKAGVMIRETLNSDSKFAMTVVTPANGTSFQWRATPGGGCSLAMGPAATAPYWVKLTRAGDTFTGAASPDGSSWTTIGSTSISMSTALYIGLCVTAHNNSTEASAQFESVSITQGSAPPPPPPPPPSGTITITTPISKIVYQRNTSNQAPVPLRGSCSASTTSVQARGVAVSGGTTTGWTVVDAAPSGGTFKGSLTLQGGWYSLEVRGMAGGVQVANTSLDRVGVGEVFIVVGHSVAAGGSINLPGSSDERGITIPDNRSTDVQNQYNDTADPQYMPPRVYTQYSDGVKPAPFGGGTYFWAKFAQYVAQNQNVPVMLLAAAFGGTSLEHWSKASQGIQFDHSFVKSSIRMPYINLYNALKQYVNHTGIRGVLADQGANDWPNPDSNQVFGYYKTWVDQARVDLGYGALAIVVNRHTPNGNAGIRAAQMKMINEVPNCFAGPDYDTLAPEDRYDGIHLSESGCWAAAQKWADAVNGGGFFSSSQPYLPTFP